MARNEKTKRTNQYKSTTQTKMRNLRKRHKTGDCWNGANATNDSRPKRLNAAPQKADKIKSITTNEEAKKLNLPRLRVGDKVDVRAYQSKTPRRNTITTNLQRAPNTRLSNKRGNSSNQKVPFQTL